MNRESVIPAISTACDETLAVFTFTAVLKAAIDIKNINLYWDKKFNL